MTSKSLQNLLDLAKWKRRQGMTDEEIAEEIKAQKEWDKEHGKDPKAPASGDALLKLAAFKKPLPPKKTEWENQRTDYPKRLENL